MSPHDAGVHRHDAGRMDAGAMDAGPVDAGPVDAGMPPHPGMMPHDGAVLDSSPPPRTHGIEARIENTSCFLNGSPPLDIVPVGTAQVFASLDATGAVSVIRAGQRMALVEKAGRIRTFAADSNGSQTKTVLDLGSDVRTDGLRGAAFRPDGAALFASYLPAGDPLRIIVERFDLASNGSADLGSREVLLTLPLTDAARSGGALAVMFDGTLLVAFGDGGDAAGASDLSMLTGKLARIDVSGDSGYAIPDDNPFVSDNSAKKEVFALGLGAPTSCSVDRVTGHVWCADTGDAQNDHILLLSPGTLTPILSYPRVSCGALVGFVSRDASLPDIQGALVFGDACSTTLQAMRFDGSLVRSQDDVATLDASLAAFGEDENGRMFAIDASGAARALVRPANSAAPSFPTTVSASGCIADMATRAPAASLIPFEVRTPLWSDGAKKHRFIVLPGQEKIGFTETGAWEFPVGTIFMKEFLLDDDNDADTADPIMETRFFIKRSDSSWEGYSYMWDRQRKDAFLLEGAEIGSYAMQPDAVDSSGASVHRHTFPDRTQCLLCHNAASGRALGLQTGRMNTDHDYDGFVENQLDAMAYVGLFTKKLPAKADDLPRFAQPNDENADLEARARSWLYANCSHCHRPGGPTPAALDFRYETPLADTHACGIKPMFTISQIPDATILNPGDSANSELFFRISRRDGNQMPPIATLITDPTGLDAVQRWIDTKLTTCP